MSSENEVAAMICRQLDVVAEAVLTPPERWHNHVCPYCLEQRDCNCVTEPERIIAVCDACLCDPTVKKVEVTAFRKRWGMDQDTPTAEAETSRMARINEGTK